METAISAVTVYSNQARIQRKGTFTLSGDEQELRVENLPMLLAEDSIRVAGRGDVGVKLLGIQVETEYSAEPRSPQRLQALREQVKGLEAAMRSRQTQIDSTKLQQNLVEDLRSSVVDPLSKSLVRQQTSVDQADALMEFVGARYGRYGEAIATLEREQAESDRQLKTLQKEIEQLQMPNATESRVVRVAIETSGSGEFELELSYVIKGASWKPLYDLEVDTQSKEIGLSYLAEVKQRTGEDWSGVMLTLSTAKPSLGSLPPKLKPWFLDGPTPPPEPVMELASIRPTAMAARKRASADGMEARLSRSMAAPEESYGTQAEVVAAAVKQTGSVVTFDVGGGSDIPSDGNPHKVTLFRDRYPAQWQHVAIPKLVSFAYLRAKVQNPMDGVTLLPGQANIFRDEDFVGQTSLKNIAPGQEFKLDLGIDEGIQIERELCDRKVSKTLIQSKRQSSYSYRITIKNLQPKPVQLEVQEQLPVARHEKIKVQLKQSSPKLEPGEMGALTWQLSLPKQGTQTIAYDFVVEHPAELEVRGLEA